MRRAAAISAPMTAPTGSRVVPFRERRRVDDAGEPLTPAEQAFAEALGAVVRSIVLRDGGGRAGEDA